MLGYNVHYSEMNFESSNDLYFGMEGVCNVLTWLCTYYVSWSSSPKLNTCGHIFFLDLFSKKSAIHLIVEDMLSDTKVFGDFINLSACMFVSR
jgi:hypothetical protein